MPGRSVMKIVAAIAASLLAFCGLGMAHAETIKIGVVLPYSGPNSDLGDQIDKAYDLYLKLHAKDLGDYKIELIKRDEGPASGANARTVVTELDHQRQGEAARRLRVLAVGDSRCAACDPGQDADADLQRRHGVDHDAVALHRALLFQHVGPGLSDGYLRGDANSAARPLRAGSPTFRPGRTRRLPSRPHLKRPAAKSSTKCAWAHPARSPTSPRSSSG